MNKDNITKVLSLVGVIAAAASMMFAVPALLNINRVNDPDPLIRKTELQIAINDVGIRLEQQSIKLEELRNQIQTIGQTASTASVLSLQVNTLSNSVLEDQKKLTSLEDIILDNPQKALALPLIRKDIDSLKENHQTSIAASKQDIDRIYDQSKWFIGLMITSAIGIIALAISNFFKKA